MSEKRPKKPFLDSFLAPPKNKQEKKSSGGPGSYLANELSEASQLARKIEHIQQPKVIRKDSETSEIKPGSSLVYRLGTRLGSEPAESSAGFKDQALDQASALALNPAQDPALNQARNPALDQACNPALNQALDQAADQAKSFKKESGANPLYGLSKVQRSVLFALYENSAGVDRHSDISQRINISQDSIKTAMKKLRERGIITSQHFRNGSFQGFSYTIHPEAILFLKTLSSHRNLNPAQDSALNPALNYALAQAVNPAPQKKTRLETSLNDIDDDSFIYIKNHHLSDEELKLTFPLLHTEGLRAKHTEQILVSWLKQKLELNLFHESLRRAEFALQHQKETMESPFSYIRTALMNGYYTRPKNYKSLEELALEEKVEVERRKQELLQQHLELSFQNWWANLPKDEKMEIDRQISKKQRALPAEGAFRNDARKTYFLDNVYQPPKTEVC